MKKLLALISLIIIINSTFAANEVVVNSNIQKVTVFLKGAQVFRKSNINIKKGISEIIFDSISSNINANSIQVKGKGKYIILDTKYKVVNPPSSTTPPIIPKEILMAIEKIQNSLDLLNFDLEEISYKVDVLELEKQLLVNNKSMQSDSLPLLKDAMAFFREKYNNINSSLIQSKKDKYSLTKRRVKLQEKLNMLTVKKQNNYTAKPAYPRYQIIVTVSADAATYGSVEINYLVNNASWSPKYDLRANGVNQPVELTYKANVYQNSGENWKNVQLTLSTNNPNKSKVKPILPVWYLNYYNKTRVGSNLSTVTVTNTKFKREQEEELIDLDELLEPAQSSAYYATMNENLSNVEFSLSIPYTIPSDGQNHMVAIKNVSLGANYQYYMVPKLDKDAFLVANIKGFEELSLLPAAANVYFEGTYIGETMLNPDVMGDSLAVTLGRDERISIRRKLLKKEEKEKFLGKDIVKHYTYEMVVKNNRINNVEIIIEDQIPLSNIKDIEVELLSNKGLNYDELTGMLNWKFNLAAKQSKKMLFGYSIKYEKDKQVALN